MIRLRHAQSGNFAYVNYQVVRMQIFLLSTNVQVDPLNVFFIIPDSHLHLKIVNQRLGQHIFGGI